METKGVLSCNNNKAKANKMKRKEILEKKKAMDELIKVASAEKDHLSAFHAFRHYPKNGLSACLESGTGDQLSSSLKHYIQNLLKANMEGPYGAEWPVEEKVKRREMVASEARYIFVYEALDTNANELLTVSEKERTSGSCMEERGSLLGFVHFRFVIEEELPVLYVYELQLVSHVQGKGLGKFLMQLIELIARKNHMTAVVLTVQKANLVAMNFYTSKMRYVISSISPSKVDPWVLRRVMKFFANLSAMTLKLSWRVHDIVRRDTDEDSHSSLNGISQSPSQSDAAHEDSRLIGDW